MTEKDDPKLFARRNLFRRGLRELLNPLTDMIANRLKDLPDFSKAAAGAAEDAAYIRPPGAQPGARLLQACIRCGACKKHCPQELDIPAWLQKVASEFEGKGSES